MARDFVIRDECGRAIGNIGLSGLRRYAREIGWISAPMINVQTLDVRRIQAAFGFGNGHQID
jgi:hypothetical protein